MSKNAAVKSPTPGSKIRSKIRTKRREAHKARIYARDRRAEVKEKRDALGLSVIPPGTVAGAAHPKFKAQQWKPGVSGNPKGRGPGLTLEEVLRKYLNEHQPGVDTTRLEDMAEAIFEEGITKRNGKIMVALFDRLWAKPLKLVGDVDNPIAITQITRTIVNEIRD